MSQEVLLSPWQAPQRWISKVCGSGSSRSSVSRLDCVRCYWTGLHHVLLYPCLLRALPHTLSLLCASLIYTNTPQKIIPFFIICQSLVQALCNLLNQSRPSIKPDSWSLTLCSRGCCKPDGVTKSVPTQTDVRQDKVCVWECVSGWMSPPTPVPLERQKRGTYRTGISCFQQNSAHELDELCPTVFKSKHQRYITGL